MAYTTIKKPSDYFNTKLYTGNNTSTSITGVGFQPDLTWFKRRDSSAQHSWFDSVRGVTKQLTSNLTNADTTITDALTSFDSDGFTLGVDSGNYINFNNATYASWSWLASNTTASNTDGSITSTVSANTTSGFSIVSYTGTGSVATVGHSLGTTPSMIIIKNRSGVADWLVYHKSIGNTGGLYLNSTGVTVTASGFFNNTSPTSSVFTIGTGGTPNNNGSNYIAYCFAEVKGFSKMGSYVGNGNADGTFVYTGFKPAWLLVKQTTGASQNWYLWDNKRDTFNVTDTPLKPDEALAESGIGAYNIDLLSNGFKFRGTETQINASGQTYIYMAFAEEPLVGDNPATAR